MKGSWGRAPAAFVFVCFIRIMCLLVCIPVEAWEFPLGLGFSFLGGASMFVWKYVCVGGCEKKVKKV